MGIFKPAWQSDKRRKALKAVDNTTAMDKLIEIAEFASHSDIQSAAIDRIDDQKVLADLVIRTSNQIASQTALGKITATDLLVEISMQAVDSRAQEAAVGKIADQSALAAIAKNHSDLPIRALAVRRLNDQAWLRDVAEYAEKLDTRLLAAESVRDRAISEALCVDIALEADSLSDQHGHDESIDLATRAIAHIADEAHLFHIVKNTASGQLRNAAMANMVERRFVAELAKADSIDIESLEQSSGWTDSSSRSAVIREAAYPSIAKSVDAKVGTLGPGLRIPENPGGNTNNKAQPEVLSESPSISRCGTPVQDQAGNEV